VTRFALTIEYDGRPFMGWQRQAHGPSVQAAIEAAAQKITGETVAVHAAGRTDAGVHATGMRAHLDVERPITPFRLMEALNAKLLHHLDYARVADRLPAGATEDDWMILRGNISRLGEVADWLPVLSGAIEPVSLEPEDREFIAVAAGEAAGRRVNSNASVRSNARHASRPSDLGHRGAVLAGRHGPGRWQSSRA
jgi:hypothetical protein